MTNSDKGQVRRHLERYVHNEVSGDAEWLKAPEIPSEQEIGWITNGKFEVPKIQVKPNKLEGPFEDKDEYLETHAELMRNDSLCSLRFAVDEFRQHPDMVERDSEVNTRIYENVYTIGLTVAREGLALKIDFSTRRTEKLIRWPQSKRLKTGSIVALSPANDNFQSKCIVAVVASRLLSNLEVQYPSKPSIQIYLGDQNDIEIDPQQEYIMIEAIGGYWEACRHTYQALKKLHTESFPLSEHIISLQQTISSPQYRLEHPVMNLHSAAKEDGHLVREKNVLNEWPAFLYQENSNDVLNGEGTGKLPLAVSDLDSSQVKALRQILTQQLAVVQGPPGTGKTYVSVVAIKVLLDNMKPGSPPIIVTAQTNHALDQLLRHISNFEPSFIRLGGQTTDFDIIKPRTLFEVKQKINDHKLKNNSTLKNANAQRRNYERAIREILSPIISDQPLSPEVCYQYGVITGKQRDSILEVESAFVGDDIDDATPMEIWCDGKIMVARKRQGFFGFGQYEEFEEFEKLNEEDLEAFDSDDEKFETLRGMSLPFFTGYIGKQTTSVSESEVEELLKKHEDLKDIAPAYRGSVYDYFQKIVTERITTAIREYGFKTKELAKELKVGRWQVDHEILRDSRVIGLTTTGLSKYRGLVTSLKPKIVLIEEAAETLEPYVAVACFESLEHLILVGDHQQLRGHCNNSDLEGVPFHFDMSMFERLVKNGIPFTQLRTQRRMRPEIRQLINPIYPDLEDHLSVLDRKDVPGMGDVNVHFFHHKWHEANDDALSKKNELEARMIAEFFAHLVYNGFEPKQITVLTFYNGQVKYLRRIFNQQTLLQCQRLRIHTVDSYQGEENDIVILSLVRNNYYGAVGFLNNINRACVSLSRARQGFYLFGNAGILHQCSEKWKEILTILMERKSIQAYLPLKCSRHSNVFQAQIHTDFDNLNGGCDQRCDQIRPCGHACQLACHPFECEASRCEEECSSIMPCGHNCTRGCGVKPCHCEPCMGYGSRNVKPTRTTIPKADPEAIVNGKAKWDDFASGGHHDADLQAFEDMEKARDERTKSVEPATLKAELPTIDELDEHKEEGSAPKPTALKMQLLSLDEIYPHQENISGSASIAQNSLAALKSEENKPLVAREENISKSASVEQNGLVALKLQENKPLFTLNSEKDEPLVAITSEKKEPLAGIKQEKNDPFANLNPAKAKPVTPSKATTFNNWAAPTPAVDNATDFPPLVDLSGSPARALPPHRAHLSRPAPAVTAPALPASAPATPPQGSKGKKTVWKAKFTSGQGERPS